MDWASYVSVWDVHQMQKGVVNFIINYKFTPTSLGKWLPSSGGYTCLISYSSIVCASGGCGLWFVRCCQLATDNTGVAYKACVTPWRWKSLAETRRGKFGMYSIIKLTTPLSICWLSHTEPSEMLAFWLCMWGILASILGLSVILLS
jgi:hypothetical protein